MALIMEPRTLIQISKESTENVPPFFFCFKESIILSSESDDDHHIYTLKVPKGNLRTFNSVKEKMLQCERLNAILNFISVIEALTAKNDFNKLIIAPELFFFSRDFQCKFLVCGSANKTTELVFSFENSSIRIPVFNDSSSNDPEILKKFILRTVIALLAESHCLIPPDFMSLMLRSEEWVPQLLHDFVFKAWFDRVYNTFGLQIIISDLKEILINLLKSDSKIVLKTQKKDSIEVRFVLSLGCFVYQNRYFDYSFSYIEFFKEELTNPLENLLGIKCGISKEEIAKIMFLSCMYTYCIVKQEYFSEKKKFASNHKNRLNPYEIQPYEGEQVPRPKKVYAPNQDPIVNRVVSGTVKQIIDQSNSIEQEKLLRIIYAQDYDLVAAKEAFINMNKSNI